MGRNAGGVNGASGLRGATERGYTTKMLENIVGKEREYRSEKIEYAHIYTQEGDLISTKKGGKNYVNLGNSPENAIVTHNHPSKAAEGGWLNTFSHQDLNYAVSHNLKEMRAVSRTHTFSMKRPPNGWGEKAKRYDIKKKYKEIERGILKGDIARIGSLVDKGKHAEAKKLSIKLDNERTHKTVKAVAEFFGWQYTMKKG